MSIVRASGRPRAPDTLVRQIPAPLQELLTSRASLPRRERRGPSTEVAPAGRLPSGRAAPALWRGTCPHQVGGVYAQVIHWRRRSSLHCLPDFTGAGPELPERLTTDDMERKPAAHRVAGVAVRRG